MVAASAQQATISSKQCPCTEKMDQADEITVLRGACILRVLRLANKLVYYHAVTCWLLDNNACVTRHVFIANIHTCY